MPLFCHALSKLLALLKLEVLRGTRTYTKKKVTYHFNAAKQFILSFI